MTCCRVGGLRAPSCCINLQIFSDDARTATLPPVPSSSPHPHSQSSLPMPHSCWMGDSDAHQVSRVASFLQVFHLPACPERWKTHQRRAGFQLLSSDICDHELVMFYGCDKKRCLSVSLVLFVFFQFIICNFLSAVNSACLLFLDEWREDLKAET